MLGLNVSRNVSRVKTFGGKFCFKLSFFIIIFSEMIFLSVESEQVVQKESQ